MGAVLALFRNALTVFRLVKDSRGKPSWAHTLAVPSVIVTMLRWFLGAANIHIPHIDVAIPAISAGEASIMLSVWLAYLGQREWTEKKTTTEVSMGTPGDQDQPK